MSMLLRCAATAAFLAFLIGWRSSFAQDAAYRRIPLVENSDGAPIDTSVQIPVPFHVPQPGVAFENTLYYFRTLAQLQDVVNNPGVAQVVTKAGHKDSLGTAAVGSMAIHLVTVSSTVPGMDPDLRPDGSTKGRTFVTSGVHAREWMAFEAVVRRLEVFQTKDFATSLQGLVNSTAPGDRNVFFVENVHMNFMPLVNPGSIKITQQNYSTCYIITNGIAKGLECQTGYLRHGRFRRKNPRDVLKALVAKDQSVDPTALLGVDNNRNLTTDAFPPNDSGLGEFPDQYTTPESTGYRGTATLSEPESTAFAWGAEQTFKSADHRWTGTAFLDVHTPNNAVYRPGKDDGEYDKLLIDTVKSHTSIPEVSDLHTGQASTALGRTDMLVSETYKIPAATFELYVDPLVAAFYHKKIVADVTGVNEYFLVSEGDTFKTQASLASDVIDATLDWASGPPYLREALILQNKTSAAGMYSRAVPTNAAGQPDPGQAETIYYKGWIALDENHRTLEERAQGERWANLSNDVQVVLAFNKPMRNAKTIAGGDATILPPRQGPPLTLTLARDDTGATVLDLNAIASITSSHWEVQNLRVEDANTISQLGAKRYEYDTYTATVKLPPNVTLNVSAAVHLAVQLADQVGLDIDSDPSTVAGWKSGKWVDYERHDPAKTPLPDTQHRGFRIDTKAPTLKKSP